LQGFLIWRFSKQDKGDERAGQSGDYLRLGEKIPEAKELSVVSHQPSAFSREGAKERGRDGEGDKREDKC